MNSSAKYALKFKKTKWKTAGSFALARGINPHQIKVTTKPALHEEHTKSIVSSANAIDWHTNTETAIKKKSAQVDSRKSSRHGCRSISFHTSYLTNTCE